MTQKSHIRKHKESVHEGVRYKCDQCEYTASQKGHLRTHKSVIHLGVIFNCGLCEYQSSYKSDLNRHRKKDHLPATAFEDLKRINQRKTAADIKKESSKMTEKEKKKQPLEAYPKDTCTRKFKDTSFYTEEITVTFSIGKPTQIFI